MYVCVYIYIYTYTCVYIYIYAFTPMPLPVSITMPRPVPITSCRGKILHTRNQHLRNHSGFPVAFSNGLSAAFPNRFRQWYVPKDCHSPSGLLLEVSNGCSVAFSIGISLLWFLLCNATKTVQITWVWALDFKKHRDMWERDKLKHYKISTIE